MDLFKQLLERFRSADSLLRLIYINVGVWVVLALLSLILKLFTLSDGVLMGYLAMPSDVALFLRRPWTLLSYMLVHKAFFHLFFNMLCLYWFGKVFLMQHSEKQLAGLYVLGGVLGGVLYMLSYNFFPLYADVRHYSTLIGASASVMAVIVASAMQMPNMQMRVLLIGNVSLKYIALATVLLSFLGITSENAGGELAHLGGALAGYLFIVFLRRGSDLTAWFSRVVGWLVGIFKPVRRKKPKYHYKRPVSDADYNQQKSSHNEQIDLILDKIKRSGYESLTNDEKATLFRR